VLHHVEIYVSNLEKSIEFWDWLLIKLGYETYQKWEQGISWKYNETYLVFVQTEQRFLEIPYHRSRVGLNHLAFHAKSKEQVDSITKELEEKGISILYKDRHPYAGGKDYYAVFFEDPDRIKVELVAPTN
jgi:catechol 2,3-dioxygenase-like lactoylglutathione lyase family enzyme